MISKHIFDFISAKCQPIDPKCLLQASLTQAHSPHGVEVIIRGNVVLVITCQAQLVAIALMDKVPQLFGAQGLMKV